MRQSQRQRFGRVTALAVLAVLLSAQARSLLAAVDPPPLPRGDNAWQGRTTASIAGAKRRAWRRRARDIHRSQAMRNRFLVAGGATIDQPRRIADLERIVGHLTNLGMIDLPCRRRQKLVEEFPGRVALAARQLHGILVSAGAGASPGALTAGRRWAQYACDRLIALNRAGQLPDAHDGVILALKARADLTRVAWRLVEADAAIRALEQVIPDDPWVRFKRAMLLGRAGRGKQAYELLEEFPSRWIAGVHSNTYVTVLERNSGQNDDPVLPQWLSLTDKWSHFSSRPLDGQLEFADGVLAEVMANPGVTSLAPDHAVSVWHALREYFGRQTPASLTPWRAYQQKEANVRFANDTAVDPIWLHRRYPYAVLAQRRLLAWAQRELVRGHSGLAIRGFRDVLDYADNKALLASARAGLWFAMAQSGTDRTAIQEAFANVPPDAVYPWMGARLTAADIRSKLLASIAVVKPDPPKQLEQRLVRDLPMVRAGAAAQFRFMPDNVRSQMWYMHGQVLDYGRGNLLVAGSSFLARIDAKTLRPRWVRSPDLVPNIPRRPPRWRRYPSATRPAIAEGRIFSRWGLNRDGEYPTSLAAFDLDSGMMLWSSAADAALAELDLISDPVAAYGRVYTLGMRRSTGGLGASIRLICQRAEDGRILWIRRLGDQRSMGQGADLTHYGGAITIRDGEVYCSTGLGFVVRCDARDGMLEWGRTYQRMVKPNLQGLWPRSAAAPVVVGRRVLFTPRDSSGVFAADKRNGDLLWDSPYVPSDEVVGVFGDTLLTRDPARVAAVDVASGEVRWMRRFDDRLRGKAAIVGESAYVGGAGGLYRISAASGVVLGRADWSDGAMNDFIIRGNRVVGIGGRSVTDGPLQFDPGSTPKAAAARKSAGLQLPLASTGRLTRPQAEVFAPPAQAKIDDLIYILSGDVLECMSLAGGAKSGSLKWRRFVAAGFKVRWWSKTLLAVYPDRVVAYDAMTGKVRWRRRWDRPIRKHYIFGDYLVFTDLRPGRWIVEAVDLADGRRLWRRSFADLIRGQRIVYGNITARHVMLDAVGWDGKDFHLILTDAQPADSYDLTCRAGDGRIIRMTPIPALARTGTYSLHNTIPGVGTIVYMGADGKLYRHRFGDDAPPTAFAMTLPNIESRRGVYGYGMSVGKIEVLGKWACYEQANQRGPAVDYIYFRLDDPKYSYIRRRQRKWRVEIRGDRLYEMSSRALTVIDLPTRKQIVRYEVPRVLADRRTELRMHSFKTYGDRVLTLSDFRPTGWDQVRKHTETLPNVRIDAFDRKTGKHLAGQTLDAPYINRPLGPVTRGAWANNGLVITGPHGVAAYATSPTGRAELFQPIRMIYRTKRSIKIDGSTDDWGDDSTVPAVTRAGSDAKLMLAHDGYNLLLAVSYTDSDVRARRGLGDYGGGDYLEVGLMGNYAQYRVTLSRDVNGELDLRNVAFRSIDPLPLERVKAAVRHDIATGRVTYEMSIPTWDFTRIGKMHLAVRVCDDRAGIGPAPVLQLGRGMIGRDTWPGMHESFHFAQRTYREEVACLDICKEAPGLAESLAFTRRYYQARAPDVERRSQYYADLIRSHAKGPLAMKMLMMLDQSLRTNIEADPTIVVRQIAKSAGVSPKVLRRYDGFTTSYLSQWVYVQKRAGRVVGWMPRYMLAIELFDGKRWSTRKSWYRYPERADNPGAVRPYDTWIQLRVPLIQMNMHNRPIYGIAVTPHLSNCAILDRTAVVTRGKEHVFIDDAFPPGKTSGMIEWVTSPTKSGSKAHRSGYSPRNHRSKYYAMFDKPITAHLDDDTPTDTDEGEFDHKRAVAALKKNIPKLDGSRDGWRFFAALLRIDAGDDLDKKIALHRWYIKANPSSPRLLSVLVALWKHYKTLAALAEKNGTRPVDPLAEMDAVIVEYKIPTKLAYDFRSNHAWFGQMFVRDWQVLGPFGSWSEEGGANIPSLSGSHDLKEKYDGLLGLVQWKVFKSTEGQVDLNKALTRTNSGVAYALCWVHSDREQEVIVEFGMNSNTHVWSPGESWLDGDGFLTIPRGHLPRPGMVSKKITLLPGWREILVKIDKRHANDKWSFWFEMIDPHGRGMPKGLKFSTTPPYKMLPVGSGR